MLLCTKNKEFSEGEGGDVCCYVQRTRNLVKERGGDIYCYVQRTRQLVKEREEVFTAMYKEHGS